MFVIPEPPYAGIRTFLRSEHRPMHPQSINNGEIAIIGVPFDGRTTYRPGARLGPSEIRNASLALCETRQARKIVDLGDIIGVAGTNLMANVEAMVCSTLQAGAFPFMLGGDHSITLHLLRAVRSFYNRPIALVHFDAHPDTWKENWGLRFSHGTFLYDAIEENLIDGANSFHIGMRSSCDSETLNYLYDHIGNVFLSETIHLKPELLDQIPNRVRTLCENVPTYMTFDIDVLDPAFAPGTGTPEIGGLATWQVMSMLRHGQWAYANWVGADVMEVSPPYDHAQITSLAAAQIALAQIEALE